MPRCLIGRCSIQLSITSSRNIIHIYRPVVEADLSRNMVLVIAGKSSNMGKIPGWERLDLLCSMTITPTINNQSYDRSVHKYEPQHEISNNVVCANSKGSNQPAHMRSLIRAVASCLNIL